MTPREDFYGEELTSTTASVVQLDLHCFLHLLLAEEDLEEFDYHRRLLSLIFVSLTLRFGAEYFGEGGGLRCYPIRHRGRFFMVIDSVGV